MNTSGSNSTQVGPTTGETVPARACIVNFAEAPLPVQKL
jgi:hypothetical protein